MKKYVAICGTLAALAWVGVAAATTAQGKLTGSAAITVGEFTVTTTIVDGGTSYVGLENDKSGNCSGDSGAVLGRICGTRRLRPLRRLLGGRQRPKDALRHSEPRYCGLLLRLPGL